MTAQTQRRIAPRFVILLLALVAVLGCRSYHVEVTVENHTGAAIQLLEVDYPSASYGADALAAGAEYHYRIQIRGTGPLKLQYTSDGHQHQITGPSLSEGAHGRLLITLLPGGKAEFAPQFSSGH